MKIVVDHIGGSRAGQRQVLEAGDRLVFGRHPKNEVSFDAYRDLDASSRHAELIYLDGGYVLRDIGSSNGTLVKGEAVSEMPVPPGVPIEIEFGSAGPRVRLFIGSPESAPPVPTGTALRSKRTTTGPRSLTQMVGAAKLEAGERRGWRRLGAICRSMLNQAIHRSTLEFKLGLALALSLFVSALVLLVLSQAGERERVRGELVREQARLAQAERDNAIRMDRAARPERRGPGDSIAERFRDTTYLLVAEPPPAGSGGPARRRGRRGGKQTRRESSREAPGSSGKVERLCAGFAVAAGYLATTAQCVLEAARLRGNGYSVFAQQSGVAARVGLGAMFTHPGYDGPFSEDVALIEVRTMLERQVTLATEDQLRELAEGANVFALGFPDVERLDEAGVDEAMTAALFDGVVGNVTDLDGQAGRFEVRRLLHHNLPASAGWSGSPVFDGRGRVIAVNGGRHAAARGPERGENKSPRRSILAPGASYAIRVDALVDLMNENQGDLAAVGSVR